MFEQGSNTSSGIALGSVVSMLALPGAVLAFTTTLHPGDMEIPSSVSMISPQAMSAPGMRLATAFLYESLSSENPYPFTPAKNPNRRSDPVPIAVRVDAQTIKLAGQQHKPADTDNLVNIAQSGFDLKGARGPRKLIPEIEVPVRYKTEQPDLPSTPPEPLPSVHSSRLSPRVVLDGKQTAGRAPRTLAGNGKDQVDVGGSYRITGNLDLTAGVRYSTDDHERLLPLTDGRQDGQAVYVGTQIRF